MKLEEILQLTETEIKQRLEDTLEELQNLRFQHATHQLDNPLRLRTLRREIAQLKTILHEFELGLRTPITQATQANVE